MPLLTQGQPAPDFAVTDHTGETVKLSDLAGKYVLLWFFPEADTPGCTTEGIGFRDRLGDLRDLGAVILGASFDSIEANKAFADKNDFPFVLLCDTSRDLGVKYGAADDRDAANARRISYLIAPDGTIARVYDQVGPTNHPRQVLEDLVELVG
jgi:peroxiredoxin Q/BCP